MAGPEDFEQDPVERILKHSEFQYWMNVKHDAGFLPEDEPVIMRTLRSLVIKECGIEPPYDLVAFEAAEQVRTMEILKRG
jgi:hypothetical protein